MNKVNYIILHVACNACIQEKIGWLMLLDFLVVMSNLKEDPWILKALKRYGFITGKKVKLPIFPQFRATKIYWKCLKIGDIWVILGYFFTNSES